MGYNVTIMLHLENDNAISTILYYYFLWIFY